MVWSQANSRLCSAADALRDAEGAEALPGRGGAGGDGLCALQGQDVREEVHGQVRPRVPAAARGGRLAQGPPGARPGPGDLRHCRVLAAYWPPEENNHFVKQLCASCIFSNITILYYVIWYTLFC